jgi:hypothetical protein
VGGAGRDRAGIGQGWVGAAGRGGAGMGAGGRGRRRAGERRCGGTRWGATAQGRAAAHGRAAEARWDVAVPRSAAARGRAEAGARCRLLQLASQSLSKESIRVWRPALQVRLFLVNELGKFCRVVTQRVRQGIENLFFGGAPSSS